MFSSPESTNRGVTPELLATILLVLAYIVWILSLPAWPSQDAPVHLYYVHVMRELLSHHATVYSRYYTIKHVLPPYALYYYALLALSKFCSLLLADRLVLCVYLILFVFGFRYLARAVGPSADLSTLLALLLALNWSAGMGFLNHCLSLALVFWAIGLWLRFTERRPGARLVFLLIVAAITLTHPVPLLILLTFCAVDWLQRFVCRGKPGGDSRRTFLTADLVVLFLSAFGLLYARHFAMSNPVSQPGFVHSAYLSQVGQHVIDTLRMHHVALIFGRNLPILLYLFGILALLGIAYALAFVQYLRNRAAQGWTPSDTWLVYAIALVVLIPFLPSDLNDAFYFTERLSILIWLAPLIAASGWTPRTVETAGGDPRMPASPGPLRLALLAFAVVINLCLLWQSNAILRPVAAQMAAIQREPISHAGQLGLILEDSREPASFNKAPSWNAFYWAGAHVFRRDEAVLENSPWLDAAIIPLGAQPTLPVAAVSTGNDASPHQLSQLFQRVPEARTQALVSADFVLITQPGLPAPSALDPLLSPPAGGKSWRCRAGAAWYQLCEPTSTR
jgi:hypothetical protein